MCYKSVTFTSSGFESEELQKYTIDYSFDMTVPDSWGDPIIERWKSRDVIKAHSYAEAKAIIDEWYRFYDNFDFRFLD